MSLRGSTRLSWKGMMQRCYNERSKDFPNYGGRGIRVASEWHDYAVFRKDMGIRPKGKTLGRINNEKGYNKDNCEWQSKMEQEKDKRRRKDNASGLTGVTKQRHRWVAYTNLGGADLLYRGKDFFEACCARKSWEARQHSTVIQDNQH